MDGIGNPDIDPNLEPQFRARSNTWPVRPREFDAESEGDRTPNSVHSENGKHESDKKSNENKDLGLNQKKGGSRKNAWGSLSYADLITQAIQSSPEGRLTLSQIYDWMVQNVTYFRDKGDSNSSAGWKNSIRHNLSLHSRFMRVQNEGTGKSSWWVINPEAKPGKSPRRRAITMDTKEYVKKRGRVKRKVEQLRASMEGASMENGASFGSAHELNTFDSFTLSPQDYRQRANSNASSIGGRLSPISHEYEDGLIPDGLTPVQWNGPMVPSEEYTDISQGLASMLMGDPYCDPLQDTMVSSSRMMGKSSRAQQLSPNGYPQDPQNMYLQVGGGYSDSQNCLRQLSPQQLSPSPCTQQRTGTNIQTTMSPSGPQNGYNSHSAMSMGGMRHGQHHRRTMIHQSLTELLEQPDGFDEPMDQQMGEQGPSMMSPGVVSSAQQSVPQQQQPNLSSASMNQQPPTYMQSNGGGTNVTGAGMIQSTLFGGLSIGNLTQEQRNQLTTSLLHQVLTDVQDTSLGPRKQLFDSTTTSSASATQIQQTQARPQQQQTTVLQNGMNSGRVSTQLMSGGRMQSATVSTASYTAATGMGAVNNTGSGPPKQDSELEFLDIMPGDFTDCPDVDQLINHELSLGHSLDFLMDNSQSSMGMQQQQSQQHLHNLQLQQAQVSENTPRMSPQHSSNVCL